ncbi:hypothetical protein [Janthinobacterium sp. Ant5-2-1]|uniref:hypothetical protein n=1 Tax=Janthinobacterium sp. Ant5-2-1 TaxID=1755239 RepID=UPI0007182032|nr:hypothetical protein [Janthinobacterium sp. Ant5-2-1]
MKQAQILAVSHISMGVIKAVEAAGDLGAPGGVLYAAMQSHGAKLKQFQSIMDMLTSPGYLMLEVDCYHTTPCTAQMKARLALVIATVER